METSNFSTKIEDLKGRVGEMFDEILHEQSPNNFRKKVALIFGITGQDGSYLAELLLKKGYEVHGVVRRVAIEDPERRLNRIKHILDKITLHSGTLENYSRFIEIFEKIRPDECYNLAAQSFVYESFEDGFSTMDMNIKGVQHVLSALNKKAPNCKFYFAASSEMFGKAQEIPQRETTPFHPRSPYGISKVTGFHLTRNYRESYGLFACNGILFNHESPRRGFEFVTRKITEGLAKIKLGLKDSLSLGNLDAKRDWGFAGDYVEAMWLILQQEYPDDFVIATRETYTVREFLEEAFNLLDLNWEDFVEISEKYKRPAEVPALLGDPSKAKNIFNWEPKVKFKDLVKMMLATDIKEKLEEFGNLAANDERMSDDFYVERGKELARKLKNENKLE